MYKLCSRDCSLTTETKKNKLEFLISCLNETKREKGTVKFVIQWRIHIETTYKVYTYN